MAVASLSSLTLGSEPVDTPVCKEHGYEFKYFCKSHMIELCLICKRIEHKNCKAVVDIEEAARHNYPESHGGKIIQSVKQLAERFGICQLTACEAKCKLHGKRQIVIDSVKRTRKSLEAYLDRLEANALAEIDDIIDKETKNLDERINICKASVSSLTASLSSLNRMMSVGNNEEKFVEINRAIKQIKQYCSMLLDLSHELCDIDVKFEENEKVSKLNILLQELGECTVVRSSVCCVNMEMKPIYSGEIQLTINTGLGECDNAGDGGQERGVHHTGDKTPVTTSFGILPDGRQLLIDRANRKLKLYDQNKFMVTEHVLSERPAHILVLSDTQAVVSTDTNTLLKITIGDGLAVTETKSKHVIGAIIRYGEDILAIMEIRHIVHVCVLDKHFTIKKTIIKDDNKTLFRTPVFLAASDDESMLFVIDCYNGCFGFTIDGGVLFHYQDQEAKNYVGLAAGRDCLFLGIKNEKGDFHVQKLHFSGEREACADFGWAWPLRVVENEIVLFMEDDKHNRMIHFYFLFQ